MPDTLLILFLLGAFLGCIGGVAIFQVSDVDGISIDNDVGDGVPTEKTAGDLVNPPNQHQDAGLIFLPEVVVGHSVGELYLPRDQSSSS